MNAIHKLLAGVSFAGCVYCVTLINVDHLAFIACFALFCWNMLPMLDKLE